MHLPEVLQTQNWSQKIEIATIFDHVGVETLKVFLPNSHQPYC